MHVCVYDTVGYCLSQAESVLYDLEEAQRLSESRLAEVIQLSQQMTDLKKELETTRHSSLQVG